MDKKRLIFAGIFILVSVAVGYLLYRVFFAKEKLTITKKPAVTTVTPGALPIAEEGVTPTILPAKPGKLPTAPTVPTAPTIKKTGQGESYPISQVADTPVLGINTSRTGLPQFYNQTDGKFYKVGADGKVQALSDEVFYNVQNVTWSPTKNESVIEYPDGSNIYYNFDTKKQVTLPKHWEQFSFSGQGDKIGAKSIGLSPENRWLVTADPQGKNITLVEPMDVNADKVTVNWSPNNQIIATALTGEALGEDRQQVLFVGLHKENFKSTIVEGRGFQGSWSPTGKKMLYSVYSTRSNYKPELWIVNSEGDSIGTGRKMLNLNTWSSKCAFNDDRFIYCAVPQTLQTGAAFAPSLADNTPDQIYKIDTETGIKSQINLKENHTVNNMYIGNDGKTLYFTDKNSTGLFSLPL